MGLSKMGSWSTYGRTGNQVPTSEAKEGVASTSLEKIDIQTKEILLPFQCFCNRRVLQCKEIILNERDVPKAIVDFVANQFVDKLVLGASSRSALSRTFKSDVPTSVSKTAPDFCSVYVISKGKVLSTRPSLCPNKHPVRQTPEIESPGNQFQSVKSDPVAGQYKEATGRSTVALGAKTGPIREHRIPRAYNNGPTGQNSKYAQGENYLDHSFQSTVSCPSQSMTTIEQLGIDYPQHYSESAQRSCTNEQIRSLELNKDRTTSSSGLSSNSFGLPSAFTQEHGGTSWSNKTMEDVESEMRRLGIEVMQAKDMYNNACQEAYNIKKQSHAWMTNKHGRVEAAQLAEDVAIVLAEKKKERCRLLLEAGQAGQRQQIMEIEEKNVSGDRKQLQEMIQKSKFLEALSGDARYRRYTIEEIQLATENFSDELKIGEGGYGPVFKGSLDHTAVAIKILRPDAAQGAEQFQQEIEVLSCIRHPNMVLLVGACPEYGCLIYEYMANGSLEDRLFCRSNSIPLPWQLRFKIAAEIATGLLFLHQTKPEPLVHRDLKPGNILLDHNFVSKIADVGLARLVPPSISDAVSQYRMTAAAGTFCYIDPEYQQTGMLGIKSDIYALGIILLQLVTAAQPMGLAHNVERALEEGNFRRLLDPNVPDWPMEETLTFINLALKCAELRKKDRPDLATLVLPELNRLRGLAENMPISLRGHHRRYSNFQEVVGLLSAGNSSVGVLKGNSST
ncbi:hypothetical protein Taro_043815 [Colocasia esculenta]|uniref:Protein kinase domain-containing protein n=1 Tax=Colocasia esculenta TaxID=4460 RepID=A0A843WSC5_COLES|nr:hypothetical protein [Colocasia esculenta]